jgi:hypothetical protein
VINSLHEVRIPAAFRLHGRLTSRISVPAIALDEKFKRQCEFRHSGPAMRSLTEKGIGKRGNFRQSVIDSLPMVIYITSFCVTGPI